MSISFSVSEVQTIIYVRTLSFQGDSTLWSNAVLVDRAWDRFDREYKAYRSARSSLKVLRMYMNALKDAIRVFDEYEKSVKALSLTR